MTARKRKERGGEAYDAAIACFIENFDDWEKAMNNVTEEGKNEIKLKFNNIHKDLG